MDFGSGEVGAPNSYRVCFQNHAIGALAAEHLADEGVRSALLVCSAGSGSASPRWEGFRERAEQRGLRAAYCVIEKGEETDPARALALDNRKLEKEIVRLGNDPGVLAVDFRCMERALEVIQALEFIADHLDQSMTSATVARNLNLSKRTLERRFQAAFGKSPAQAIRQERMKATLRMLAETALPLKVVSARNGWAEPAHMGRNVKQATGLTPARYREKHASPGASSGSTQKRT